MIVHDVAQGSSEWFALRLGIPTCSSFSRIITPARLEYSKSAQSFAAQLIAERKLGRPVDDADLGTIWTSRGTDMEVEARLWYELYRDVEVQQVGFVTTNGGKVGGSPDGLVGDDGIVEIKCYGAKHHMEVVLGIGEIASRLQVQGYLWLTERPWLDMLAYNPDLPKKLVRVHQDPTVQEAIGSHLDRFLEDIERAEAELAECGDVIEDDGLLTALIASVKAGKS